MLSHIKPRVIVNADDYGANAGVTSAILECLRNQWVDQTTMLVNYSYAREAVERARGEGFSDRVGLHLNFSRGQPLTKAICSFKEICDGDGCFKPHNIGNGLLPFRGGIVAAIHDEARAQIERYCSYDLPLMHCDGHQHIHNRLQFAYIVLPLLQEYGFKSVRNRFTIFTRPWIRAVRGRLRIGIFETLARHYGLRFTQGFGGWDGGPLVKWRGFDSIELMVHPNYDKMGTIVNVLDYRNVTGPKMIDISEALRCL